MTYTEIVGIGSHTGETQLCRGPSGKITLEKNKGSDDCNLNEWFANVIRS